MLHNNWFLTVFEKNIIPIVWVTLVISAALTGATYLVDPIYSAKTELILDASLERILPYMQEGFPTTNSGDYIRAEYFAIDSINLMQQPKIGEKVIIDNKLSDNNGDKIDVDSFINPSVLELLFSTGGQGVTVKWISDTQQFSVTGYGKDIHTAAMLSTQYTNAFLENDKKQFNNILKNLKKRNEIILNSALIKELAVINEQAALRKKYGVANWSERIEDVTAALAVVEDRIFSEEIEKSTSTARLKEYEKQLRELKKPVHLSETEQKSELLATLQDTLTTLVTELAAASIEFTPNHPDYRKIQKKIDVIRQQIANETKREYLQSTHSTSSALDSILTNIMEIRVNQEVRTIKLNEFNRLKEEYLNGLNFLGNGEAAYSDLTVQKTKLNDIKQSAMQDVLKIGALLEHPFSFFRVTSEPFIDINNIDSAKFFPNRKLTLVVSLTGVFMICFFFIFIRELHTETLYSAWQLRGLSGQFEAIDFISYKNSKRKINSARHLFNFHNDSVGIIRVRSLDGKSDPRYTAKLAADYYVRAGESTLLINNRNQALVSMECSQGRGLNSWLTGHVDEAGVGIQHSSKGYYVMYDEFQNSKEPWVRTMPEIRDIFSTLLKQYNKVVLLDPSLNTDQLLAGDGLTPEINIMTVRGGSGAVSQVLATVHRELQTSQGNRNIIHVMNNKEPINLFTIYGIFKLLGRFLVFPIEIFYRQQA